MPERDQPLITALYGRTSQDDPRRVTIEIQQETLRGWAGRDPLVRRQPAPAEFWDDGVSGKLPLWERPAGKRLLEAVAAGKVQAVAVALADRFGRTLLDGLQAVKALEDRGVKLVAVNDGWDARRNDSPLYFQFRMMMAEEEHRRISQRMAAGKARAMERDGAPPGGPLTFGYRMDAGGRYVPDPREAPVVREIFRRYLAGESALQIAAWAATTGVPAGRRFQKRDSAAGPRLAERHKGQAAGCGGAWHSTKVGKILRCRTYTGERRWGGRVFACAALVGREDFDRAQALLARRDTGSGVGKRWEPSHGLLTGLLRCAGCGAKYYFWRMRVRGRAAVPYYVCRRVRCGGACNGKLLRQDRLDAAVWALVEGRLRDCEALLRSVDDAEAGAAGDALEAEEGRLVAALEAVDREVAEVWAEQRANAWPVSFVSARLNELAARREQAAATLAEVRQRRGEGGARRERAAGIREGLQGIRRRLKKGLAPEEKRHLLLLLLAGCTVETAGKGKAKTADVRLKLWWGEEIGGASPASP